MLLGGKEMNKVKIVIGVFILTCVLSVMNVKADSYLGLVGVKVPAMLDTYTTGNVKKTTISNQYIKKIGATDVLSGDEREIGARLQEVTTYYVTTEKGKYVQLFNDNAGLGATPGNYKLTLRAGSWRATAASFSGNWVLDDYLL